MTYFSTFSGVGGFEIALDALGHECVGFSEIDEFASSVYRHHFPTHTPYGDITEIDADSLPDFDLFVGGFPCQSHSVAGKRGGLSDKRGELFWDVIRILEAKTPQWFILENVAGLLSSDGGRAMGTILGALADLGYGVAYRVLDAQNFGVPQRRRRVFFVGHLGDDRAGKVLALSEGLSGNPAPGREAQQDPAADVEGCAGSATAIDFRNLELKGSVSGTLQAKSNGGYSLNYMTVVLTESSFGQYHDGVGTLKASRGAIGGGSESLVVQTVTGDDVPHTLRADGPDASEDGTGRGTPIIAFSSKDHGVDAGATSPTLRAMNFDTSHLNGGGQIAMAFNARQDTDSWKERTGPLDTDGATQAVAFSENQRAEVLETPIAGSLKTSGGKPGQGYPAVRTTSTVRRLTPTECERLMSWPDGWTKYGRYEPSMEPRRGLAIGEWNDGTTYEMSDSRRYKMCGNGVVSSVVYEIAARLGEHNVTQ